MKTKPTKIKTASANQEDADAKTEYMQLALHIKQQYLQQHYRQLALQALQQVLTAFTLK